MTLNEVESIDASPLPVEFSELRDHPDQFRYIVLGRTTSEALPIQQGIVMALGIYSVTEALEQPPREELQHGLISDSPDKLLVFGNALLRNHKQAVALAQRYPRDVPLLEAIAESAYKRTFHPRARYDKGVAHPKDVLLGGYLFSPNENRHNVGVFINNEIMPEVSIGIEDVVLDYKYHYFYNRRHPSSELRSQAYLIPGESEPKDKLQAFRETVASLVVAARVEKGLEAMRTTIQRETNESAAHEQELADVIALPLAA